MTKTSHSTAISIHVDAVSAEALETAANTVAEFTNIPDYKSQCLERPDWQIKIIAITTALLDLFRTNPDTET